MKIALRLSVTNVILEFLQLLFEIKILVSHVNHSIKTLIFNIQNTFVP